MTTKRTHRILYGSLQNCGFGFPFAFKFKFVLFVFKDEKG